MACYVACNVACYGACNVACYVACYVACCVACNVGVFLWYKFRGQIPRLPFFAGKNSTPAGPQHNSSLPRPLPFPLLSHVQPPQRVQLNLFLFLIRSPNPIQHHGQWGGCRRYIGQSVGDHSRLQFWTPGDSTKGFFFGIGHVWKDWHRIHGERLRRFKPQNHQMQDCARGRDPQRLVGSSGGPSQRSVEFSGHRLRRTEMLGNVRQGRPRQRGE